MMPRRIAVLVLLVLLVLAERAGPAGKDRHWADRNQQHARELGGGPFLNWETPDPETWVPKGYVVLRVDGRGTGRTLPPYTMSCCTMASPRPSPARFLL